MMIFENMLRKRHQAEKTMYYIILFIYNSYPKPENSHAQKAE